jgi:ABC-type branched-subunit amino acid transport system substrate-binding protein
VTCQAATAEEKQHHEEAEYPTPDDQAHRHQGRGRAGATLFAPPFIKARGEEPVKIGLDNPLTGTYAAVGKNELVGCQLAIEQINAKGGILGRQVQLLVEDSTSGEAGTAVQKARKLIERDQVNFLVGNVNSALALAMAGVSYEKGILHIVPGGHTDGITGASCHWNVFRVCNTTTMEANAVTSALIKNVGKKWYYITPDYAFGHTLQDALEKAAAKMGGTKVGGDLTPLATTDFSSYLIKAQSANPDIIMFLVQGDDMINAPSRRCSSGSTRSHLAGAQQGWSRSRAFSRGADRDLGIRVVLEAARQPAREGLRRRHQEEDRKGPDGAHLVRLHVDLELRSGGEHGQVAERAEDGEGSRRPEASPRGGPDAQPDVLPREDAPAHHHALRRQRAGEGQRPRGPLQRDGAREGRRRSRFARGSRLQDDLALGHLRKRPAPGLLAREPAP